MNLRHLAYIAIAIGGAALVLLPGPGLMGPAAYFGHPRFALLIPMAVVIFCAVYFGTLKFWELLTGDRLEKPLPTVLALVVAVRLTVDCARMLMWW
jgi:hypothetical protein